MKKIVWIVIAALMFASCSAKLTEKVMEKFPNGQPQVVQMLDRSGDCVKQVEYYKSGQVYMEGPMKNGRREGEWKSYFPDGRTQSIGYYEAGERTGAATVYWYNGNLREQGFYKNSRHCGKWRYYDEQGNFKREDDYGE